MRTTPRDRKTPQSTLGVPPRDNQPVLPDEALQTTSGINSSDYTGNPTHLGETSTDEFHTTPGGTDNGDPQAELKPSTPKPWQRYLGYLAFQGTNIASLQMLDKFRRNCAIEAAKREDCTVIDLIKVYATFLPTGIELDPDTRNPIEEALLSVFLEDFQKLRTDRANGLIIPRHRCALLKTVAEKANIQARLDDLDPAAAIEEYKKERDRREQYSNLSAALVSSSTPTSSSLLPASEPETARKSPKRSVGNKAAVYLSKNLICVFLKFKISLLHGYLNDTRILIWCLIYGFLKAFAFQDGWR